MVGTAAQIARDIAALEHTVAELADSFHCAYFDYLTALGQAIRRQLILACYHICTQSHPDRFLKLSYNQRQQLQKTLQCLAIQAQDELLACLLPPGIELLTESAAPEAPASTVLFSPDPAFPLEPSFFLPAMPPHPVGPSPSPAPAAMAPEGMAPRNDPGTDAPPASPAPKPITPLLLSQWHRDLEQAIDEELRTASHAANRILQQAGILSKALPEALLDMTASTEGADMGGHVPNVLNLLVGEGMGELLGNRGMGDRELRRSQAHRSERRPS